MFYLSTYLILLAVLVRLLCSIPSDSEHCGIIVWLSVSVCSSIIYKSDMDTFVHVAGQYPTFYQQHPGNNSLASYLTTFLSTYVPTFLSATEVEILRMLGPRALKSNTNLVFKVLQPEMIEESTNTSYGTLLKNMTNIASFAQGILVPKNLIWPIDNGTNYLQPHTNIVQTAHAAKLYVFAYTFANDEAVFSFNYSYDPIQEYLGYIGDTMTVDGVVTDFPVTAAEAISKSSAFLINVRLLMCSIVTLYVMLNMRLKGILWP